MYNLSVYMILKINKQIQPECYCCKLGNLINNLSILSRIDLMSQDSGKEIKNNTINFESINLYNLIKISMILLMIRMHEVILYLEVRSNQFGPCWVVNNETEKIEVISSVPDSRSMDKRICKSKLFSRERKKINFKHNYCIHQWLCQLLYTRDLKW